MAATNRYINWKPVKYGVTIISGVKSVSFSENPTILEDGADDDIVNTVAAVTQIAPEITVSTIDAMALAAEPAGGRKVFEATLLDAYNKSTTGGGGMKLTVTNAYIKSNSTEGSHRSLATRSITFGCISLDGVTHPCTWTAL